MKENFGLGPGAEFDRLRAVFAKLGARAGDLGDDCAVVRVGGATLVTSIDASLEGVHFQTEWLSLQEIGWRSTAAALSDLAADAARPVGVLATLGIPLDAGRGEGAAPRDPAAEIMEGVADAVSSAGGRVLGGDLIRSERYLVDICVLGTAARPVRRRGARAGDLLWVTGTLGAPARALAEFRAGRKPEPAVRTRFARPEPRIGAGRWLAARGARAMIDISDGLAADAGHLAAASGLQVAIDLERIPCWPGVPAREAAGSGEEYELLVALPAAFGERDARAFRRACDLPLTCIGRCMRGAAGVRLTANGNAAAPVTGYDHFTST